jgi:hypothetical protein
VENLDLGRILRIMTEECVEQASLDPKEIDSTREMSSPAEALSQPQGQVAGDDAELNKIKDLPKELGVMLLTAGIVGFILPGPGTPAIIAGGLALWPEAFGKLESWLERSHPTVHRQGVRQINRFLNDLEKRYPYSNPG